MNLLGTLEYAQQKGIEVKEFPIERSSGYFSSLYASKFSPQSADIFLQEECENIVKHFESGSTFKQVNQQGLSNVPDSDEVGSHRILTYDNNFAKVLTSHLFKTRQLSINPIILDEYSPVDWLTDNPQELNYWIPLHVSPVFRYMRYKKGGMHLPHYDAPFYKKETPLVRTLQSGLLYLNDNSMCTRFLHDNQTRTPFKNRDHSDWIRYAEEDEIKSEFTSEQGTVLIFPHQMLHDTSENLDSTDRIVIRFDIYYQAIGKV